MVVYALYAGLDDPEQCKHLLLDTQQLPWGEVLPKSVAASINTAVQSFDKNDEYQLTTQLNGIACLARLCDVERQNALDGSTSGSSHAQPCYTMATSKGAFEFAISTFMHAFKVSDETQHCHVWYHAY